MLSTASESKEYAIDCVEQIVLSKLVGRRIMFFDSQVEGEFCGELVGGAIVQTKIRRRKNYFDI